MGFQLSPGVQIAERDLSSIIPAVATTPAGMVGQFRWGPANQRITVGSENDLYQLFGAPDSNTFQYFFSAANFLQYANNITIVRGVSGAYNSVAGNTACTGGILLANRDAYDASINNETYSVATNAFFGAKWAGVFGNSLRIEVCDSTTGFAVWGLSSNFSNAPGTSVFAGSVGATGDEIHVVVIDQQGLFSGATGTILEIYEGLSKAQDARKADGTSNYFRNVLNDTSKYIYALNNISGIVTAVAANGTTGFGSINGFASAGGTGGLYLGGFTAGSNGNVLSGAEIASKYTTFFGDADNVDVSLLIAGPLTGSNAASVANVALSRKDCVAFVSAPNFNPSSATVDTDSYANCVATRNAIGNNSYAFMDSSWKLQYDRYNDTNRWVPCNGDVAGLVARTDDTNDPWWSPAGFNRGNIKGAIRLGWNPNQTYRDLIYPRNINPIVSFPGEGVVLYGDKTMQTRPSAFDRINVRRLFITIEKAISIAAKYQLFEFNDAFTRAMFISMVEPFLRDVQARRGIYDFKVICDETNNTSQVIDSNQFIADIYIKPARSINFIKLNFIATRTGVNFEEVAAITRPSA